MSDELKRWCKCTVGWLIMFIYISVPSNFIHIFLFDIHNILIEYANQNIFSPSYGLLYQDCEKFGDLVGMKNPVNEKLIGLLISKF